MVVRCAFRERFNSSGVYLKSKATEKWFSSAICGTGPRACNKTTASSYTRHNIISIRCRIICSPAGLFLSRIKRARGEHYFAATAQPESSSPAAQLGQSCTRSVSRGFRRSPCAVCSRSSPERFARETRLPEINARIEPTHHD